MARNYKQGKYQVQNKEKYTGTRDPTFRSSWELYVFRWCDSSPHIIEWGSETVIIPYYNEVKGRKARYMMDVYIKYKHPKTGQIRKALIEIKPEAQTKPPRKGKKRKDVYEQEWLTYVQNQNKWEAARRFAKERGCDFEILTENQLFR